MASGGHRFLWSRPHPSREILDHPAGKWLSGIWTLSKIKCGADFEKHCCENEWEDRERRDCVWPEGWRKVVCIEPLRMGRIWKRWKGRGVSSHEQEQKEKSRGCVWGILLLKHRVGYGLNCVPSSNTYVDVITPSISELHFSWKWSHCWYNWLRWTHDGVEWASNPIRYSVLRKRGDLNTTPHTESATWRRESRLYWRRSHQTLGRGPGTDPPL